MASNNISAVIKDGTVQDSTASSLSLSKVNESSNSSLDKDAFLQLLVAQMKYQDPLEPTDNTEYISQLATFSQLEEMQNMSSSFDLQRASGLVGQEIVCKVTNASTGATEYVSGICDYVVYENNKAYVSIDESLYSVDDVYQVIDGEYSQAYNLAKQFASALSSFPALGYLTTDYEDAINTLRTTYDEMSSYQKTFLDSSVVETLEKYEAKLASLKNEAAKESKSEGEDLNA